MLVLSASDVEALLDFDTLIEAMAVAMGELSAGRAHLPARTAVLVDGSGLLDMPSWIPSGGALATQVVSVFPGNAGGPRPVRQAVILAFDPADGTPAALLDA